MPDHPLRIFLSYRRKETQGYVGWLAYCLEAQFGQGNVFRDVEALGLGDWRRALDASLRMSDVVLCVMGPGWATATHEGTDRRRLDDDDDVVRWEMAAALRF